MFMFVLDDALKMVFYLNRFHLQIQKISVNFNNKAASYLICDFIIIPCIAFILFSKMAGVSFFHLYLPDIFAEIHRPQKMRGRKGRNNCILFL